MAIFPEGVNAIGAAAIVGFITCWLGAALSFWALYRYRGGSMRSSEPFSTWRDPEARKRFLPFVGFCCLGVSCVAIALVFGGWPNGYEQ